MLLLQIQGDSPAATIASVFEPIWDSIALKIATMGVVFIVLGFLSHPTIWSGLLPIWGVGLVLAGLGGYVAGWYIRRPKQRNVDWERQNAS